MFLTQSDIVLKKLPAYQHFSTFLCAEFNLKNSDCTKEFDFRRFDSEADWLDLLVTIMNIRGSLDDNRPSRAKFITRQNLPVLH